MEEKNLFLILFLFPFALSSNLGELCQVSSQNITGTCTLLEDCPGTVESVKNGKYPQICSFQGAVPIICCVPELRISEKRCREYEPDLRVEISPLISNHSSFTAVKNCQIHPVGLFPVKTYAHPKEFPHAALLGFRKDDDTKWLCGGTLISDRFVLTAAHCLLNRIGGTINVVRLGQTQGASPTESANFKEFAMSKIIAHPDFKSSSVYNDIALVQLNETVKFNDYIRPACLHGKLEIPGRKYITAGWGLYHYVNQERDYLKKLTLDKFSDEECNSFYGKLKRRMLLGFTPESQICAGLRYGRETDCQGDSGGPLLIYNPEIHCMYSAVGITSFGVSCNDQKIPGLYTRISNYIEWIEKNVWL